MLSGIFCIVLGFACDDTPPATAVVAPVSKPAIAVPALANPLPSKRPVNKPTGFPPDCRRIPPAKWQHLYVSSARRYGVDACDLAILTWCESNFNTRAESPVGAKGLPQFMDPTARELGVKNSFDPAQAIPAAARYLVWVRGRWPTVLTMNDVKGLGLGSWNWGDGNMKKDQQRNYWLTLAEAFPHLPPETRGFIKCNQTGER